ncbi:FAD-dependent oxidoreductase [Horticoccus sp. 23ND18S-11]|uniref:FAD-dependent oxidoreductase n=1 Tax=Horticoccus sp. 23ND18S-11 TaxID=3391832 RepID=UPI0039C950FA
MNSPQPTPSRRKFLQTAATGIVAGPLALAAGSRALAAESPTAQVGAFPNFARGEVVRTGGRLLGADRFVETERTIPVAGHSDVLVVGAGPAGIGAALAAARAGAKTQLIESAGCLGGVWTAGMLTKIIDGGRKTGIMQEILQAMVARGSDVAKKTKGEIYDPELMKLVLEEKCVAAGIKIQLHTQLVGAVTDARKRLTAVITESKSGRQAWTADRFIDCSGDGDLAAQAGCRFDVGINAGCECQPMSLMALLTGLDADAIPEFVREIAGEKAKANLQKLMKDSGINPSYSGPTLRLLHSGIFSLMTNHEYGVPAYDAGKISDATIRARREVHDIVRDLRKLGGPWKGVAVVATAEQIGVREGRRVRGRATVTADDISAGKKHADAVCQVNFGFDVHNVRPGAMFEGLDEIADEVRRRRQAGAKPYDIPLGALIPADVEGLMMAGRCISGDFIAHSSYRVTGNAVPMGEAAGRASVISLRKGRMPHEITAADFKSA